MDEPASHSIDRWIQAINHRPAVVVVRPLARPAAKRPLLRLYDPQEGRASPVCLWVGLVGVCELGWIGSQAQNDESGLHRVQSAGVIVGSHATPHPPERERVQAPDLSFVAASWVPYGPTWINNRGSPDSTDQKGVRTKKDREGVGSRRKEPARHGIGRVNHLYVEAGPPIHKSSGERAVGLKLRFEKPAGRWLDTTTMSAPKNPEVK